MSELIRQERLMVIDSFQVDAPKTKVLLKKLNDMKIEGNVLIVSDNIEENLYLAARNLHEIELSDATAAAADPVSLVRADKVIMTEAAIKELEGLLQ